MENKEEKGIFVRVYDWFKNLTVKGLLGAILVAFVIIIVLMSVSHLPSIMGRISDSFSTALYSVFIPAEGATVTVDKKIINSGEDFTVTFKKGDLVNGIFTISYSCNSNADLMSVENTGLKKITCDTPYYLLENETLIKVRAITKENVVRLILNGAFENNETLKSENVGVIRVTVANNNIGSVITPATTTPNVPTYNPAPYIPSQPAPVPTYNLKPDLAVRILQVGLLNNSTNLITPRNQFSYSDMVGIKFEIRNDGDTNTGNWAFTASLPSVTNPMYSSNTQISLRPGESIIFTLGFSNLTNQYSNQIKINIDPINMVSESNESNNTAIQTITNTTYNNNNYYNNYNNNQNNNTNTGCYDDNGWFTYNCPNNNYNNNYNNNGYYDNYGNWISYNNNNNNSNGYYDNYGNWISYNNNYNTLGVTCYGSLDNSNGNDRIHWYASAFGGNGDYNYTWTGTNGLSSSSKNPYKTYSSTGTKTATITVESDGYSVSHTCSVYID